MLPRALTSSLPSDVSRPHGAVGAFGSPDAPALDILIDGEAVAQGLESGTVTDFAPLAGGEHSVQVVPTGEAAASALIDESIQTDEGGVYTIAIADLLKISNLSLWRAISTISTRVRPGFG